MDGFAAELDALRRASGKSYRRLAEECGLGFNTIAGYCAGRHLPQLAVHREFRRLLEAVGVPAGPDHDTWLSALAALRSPAGRSMAAADNPYRGLLAFQPEDAAMFFGREELTRQVIGGLAASGERELPLVVVGPSGSGKSSLLRAGLIPNVESPVLMTPGARPMRQWEREGAGSPAESVLVVDQFEELFTLCPDERERRRFLDALLNRGGPVVIGMRADFYEHALRHDRLAKALQHTQIVVGPMTEAQLRRTIVEPARQVGITLEQGLVELLLRDAAGQPGSLPLLSYTLQSVVELARRTEPGAAVITAEHYRAAGGVRGAVSTTADVAYAALPPRQRATARHLFLRLVNTDDAVADTRRRVTFDELFAGRSAAESDDLAEIVDVFVARRLLVVGDRSVEVAHEALVAAWPLLGGWLAEDRAGHHIHGKLTAAARTWAADERSPESLYRGGALTTALDWAANPGPYEALNPLEREFLAASSQAASARQALERRRVRRGYLLVSMLLALVVLASGAAFYARRVTADADRDAQVALSRQTAIKAERLRQKDPALAAQLAVAAYAQAPTVEARAALLDASATPVPGRLRAFGAAATVMASAGDLLAAGSGSGQIRLWRAGTDGVLHDVGARITFGRAITAMALSGDGTLLAVGDADGSSSVWRVARPAHPVPLPVPPAGQGRVFGLAFSPDERTLALAHGAGTTELWAVDGRSPAVRLNSGSTPVRSVAFSGDGRVLASGGDDGTVRMWRTTGGRPVALASLTGPTGRIYAVAISPDSRTLAAGTAAEHNVYTWDISDPAHARQTGEPLSGPAGWINCLAFSPDNSTVAAGSSDTQVWRWDLHTRQSTGTLPHPSPVTAIGYRGDGVLDSLAGDGTVRAWPVPGPVLARGAAQVFSVSFDATGSHLLAGDGNGELRLWDVADRLHPAAAAPPLAAPAGTVPLAGASALTPDGRTAIGGSTDGTIRLWDVGDPAHPRSLGGPLQVARATIEAIALSGDGRTAAVSSDDGSVHLVDLSRPARARIVAALGPAAGIAFGVRFSPDGRLLAVAAENAKGYVYDVRDHLKPRLVKTVTGFKGAVYAAAFSADGEILAFGGADYAVRLVDLTRPGDPRPLPGALIGPVGEVYELSFSPRANVLAVSSIDGTVWLWDLARRGGPRLLATLEAAQGGLFTIAFGPDGHTLAAAGRDTSVRLWDTDPAAVRASICRTAGDAMTRTEWAQFIPGRPYEPPCG